MYFQQIWRLMSSPLQKTIMGFLSKDMFNKLLVFFLASNQGGVQILEVVGYTNTNDQFHHPILRKCIRSCLALKNRNPLPIHVMQCPTSWIAPMPSRGRCGQRKWRDGSVGMWRSGGIHFFSKLAANLPRA